MKSKFKTQLDDSVELELKGTTMILLIQDDIALPLNVDEVETFRDELDRYARAMRGVDAMPPAAMLTGFELTAVVERLDSVLLADGAPSPVLRDAVEKLTACWRAHRQLQQAFRKDKP